MKKESCMKKITLGFIVLWASMGMAAVFKHHLPEGWYPRDSGALQNVLASLDQGGTRNDAKESAAAALIVPHAGYQFSGAVAAAGYRLLDKNRIQTVIILAPSHRVAFKGVALPFFSAYQTPLGTLTVAAACVQKLAQSSLFEVRPDVWGQEHSLEVQLPFIQQYLGNEVAIVPLIVGSVSPGELSSIARSLRGCIDEHTLVVISSDFIHHGKRFGYAPFEHTADVQKSIAALDKNIIDTIIQKKEADVRALLNTTRATVCGAAPIRLFKRLQEMGAWPDGLRGRLVTYDTSYTVTKDPVNSVSYAAIIFTKKDAA